MIEVNGVFRYAGLPCCGNRYLLETFRKGIGGVPKTAESDIHIPVRGEGLPGLTPVRPVGNWLVSAWAANLGPVRVHEADELVKWMQTHTSAAMLLDDYKRNKAGAVSELFTIYSERCDLLPIGETPGALLAWLSEKTIVHYAAAIKSVIAPMHPNEKSRKAQEEHAVLIAEINEMEPVAVVEA